MIRKPRCPYYWGSSDPLPEGSTYTGERCVRRVHRFGGHRWPAGTTERYIKGRDVVLVRPRGHREWRWVPKHLHHFYRKGWRRWVRAR